MSEQIGIITIASLTGLCVVVVALLRAWGSWLSLKRCELERGELARSKGALHDLEAAGSPIGAARIEIADMKERIRKLEAIASGVDL